MIFGILDARRHEAVRSRTTEDAALAIRVQAEPGCPDMIDNERSRAAVMGGRDQDLEALCDRLLCDAALAEPTDDIAILAFRYSATLP